MNWLSLILKWIFPMLIQKIVAVAVVASCIIDVSKLNGTVGKLLRRRLFRLLLKCLVSGLRWCDKCSVICCQLFGNVNNVAYYLTAIHLYLVFFIHNVREVLNNQFQWKHELLLSGYVSLTNMHICNLFNYESNSQATATYSHTLDLRALCLNILMMQKCCLIRCLLKPGTHAQSNGMYSHVNFQIPLLWNKPWSR